MKQNIIADKSYAFALRTIKLYQYIQEKKEYTLSKQLLRSGTSIWANVEESIWWQSEKDFLSKISIAYKEARETKYWLRLLRDSGFIDEPLFLSFIDDIEELLKLLGTIQKTMKNKWEDVKK